MTSKLNKQTKKTTTSNKAKQIKDKQNKVNRINKARSQDFLRRGAIQQGEGPNEPGGGGGGGFRLSETAFRAAWKTGYFSNF